MAIIINEKPLKDPEHIIMVDDGTGSSIVIPTLLISKETGKELTDFLTDPNIPENWKNLSSISAEFYISNPDNRVEYDIWYTPLQKSGLTFIHNFHSYNTLYSNNTLMTPRIVLWGCPGCMGSEYDNMCLGNNKKYCASPNNDYSQNGKKIVFEGLREKCIYNISFQVNQGEKWWEYMDYLYDYCFDTMTSSCRDEALYYVGIDKKKLNACIENSFFNDKEDNFLLREDYELIYASGIVYNPAVVINNLTYRGDLDPQSVFSAICAGFNETISVCNDKLNPLSRSSGSIIFVLVILLVIVNVILFYCYRRYTKREMREEMQLQITSVMTQYFALSDTSKIKKEDKP